jgi:hypothetical protein
LDFYFKEKKVSAERSIYRCRVLEIARLKEVGYHSEVRRVTVRSAAFKKSKTLVDSQRNLEQEEEEEHLIFG